IHNNGNGRGIGIYKRNGKSLTSLTSLTKGGRMTPPPVQIGRIIGYFINDTCCSPDPLNSKIGGVSNDRRVKSMSCESSARRWTQIWTQKQEKTEDLRMKKPQPGNNDEWPD